MRKMKIENDLLEMVKEYESIKERKDIEDKIFNNLEERVLDKLYELSNVDINLVEEYVKKFDGLVSEESMLIYVIVKRFKNE